MNIQVDLNTAAQAVCNGDATTSSTGGLGIGLGEYSHQPSAFNFGNDSNIYGTGEFGSHLPDFPRSNLYILGRRLGGTGMKNNYNFNSEDQSTTTSF